MVGILRIKDQNGEWQDIQALRGEQGPAGPAGKDGPVGPQGPKGADGTMTFSDLTPEQKESLRGPQGIQGPQGEKGEKGDTGEKGADGAVGPQGEKGEQGPIGETGPQGEIGPQGPAGQDGKDGSDYVLTEEDKAEIAGMVEVTGGGGSVAIDGTTIIENADGTISTAIGGSKVVAQPATAVLNYENEVGFTRHNSNNNRYATYLSNQISGLDKNIKYSVELEYRNANTNETGSCVGYIIYTGTSTLAWTAYDLAVFNDTIKAIDYASAQGVYLTGTSNGVYQIYYITKFNIIAPPIYTYETIDAGFVPVGAGLMVNANGELETTIGGLEMYDGTTIIQTGGGCGLFNNSKGRKSVILGDECGCNTNQGNDFNGAVVVGRKSIVSGNGASAFGEENKAYGWATCAIGSNNEAKNTKSSAFGSGLSAGDYLAGQQVYGKFNEIDNNGEYPIIIGNGTSGSNRRNALTINADNQVHIPGALVVGENKALVATQEYVDDAVANAGGGNGNNDSYNIRHEDSNVGEAINRLRDAVEGITYIDFLAGENCGWEEELNTVEADISIINEELYNHIMNDMAEEILLSVDIQGETWGRGFGCNAWREESDGNILYVAGGFEEGFEFDSIVIDTTNQKMRLTFRHGDFNNQEVREFTIRLMDIARSVKFINPEEGIWVARNNGGEEYRLGVRVDGSIGINRNGELSTESWWIPHGDSNVGNKLEELRHQLEGVEFLNFWMGTNFASNVEEMRLSADLIIDSGDIHNQVVFEDEAEEIELSCDFGLEHDWSNGFSGRFIRSVTTDEDGESIKYEANFDGGFLTRAVINVTAGKIKFFFNEGEADILNRPMNYMHLRLVNVNRFVKHIHVGDGLWINRNDGGAVQTIGINVDSSLRFNDNRLGVNTNGLFTIIDEFFPIAWNVGPIDLTSDYVSFSVDNRYSESDFVNWIENVMRDYPKLTLELRLEDGGSGGRGMPDIGWDEDGAGRRTYTIDMSSAIGPNFKNDTGIYQCYIRYTTNSDNRFTVELSRDLSAGNVPPLNKIVWGISNNQLGMAHYFIRNPEQFSFYNENGYRYIEINEGYINRLIDERIANYHANA